MKNSIGPEIFLRSNEPSIDVIRAFYRSCGYTGSTEEHDKIILARAGSDVIGAVRLVEEEQIFLLRGMFLRDDWHRRGVGSKMLAFFEDLVRSRNIPSVYLVCAPHLNSFYGQIGFKVLQDPSDTPSFLAERCAGYVKIFGEQTIMRWQVRP